MDLNIELLAKKAIEAKEHVKVNRESKTLATITFQNFFNKYKNGNGFPNVYSFIIHYKNCIID